mmetsp:Transcript_29082/g.67452  ORF Transcript_29082/g.67452 Transcript_29082/m.67452 type:complete len:382 (+) Transcript_29082:448-1593(+)
MHRADSEADVGPRRSASLGSWDEGVAGCKIFPAQEFDRELPLLVAHSSARQRRRDRRLGAVALQVGLLDGGLHIGGGARLGAAVELQVGLLGERVDTDEEGRARQVHAVMLDRDVVVASNGRRIRDKINAVLHVADCGDGRGSAREFHAENVASRRAVVALLVSRLNLKGRLNTNEATRCASATASTADCVSVPRFCEHLERTAQNVDTRKGYCDKVDTGLDSVVATHVLAIAFVVEHDGGAEGTPNRCVELVASNFATIAQSIACLDCETDFVADLESCDTVPVGRAHHSLDDARLDLDQEWTVHNRHVEQRALDCVHSADWRHVGDLVGTVIPVKDTDARSRGSLHVHYEGIPANDLLVTNNVLGPNHKHRLLARHTPL